jgi:ATP-dependent DNA helicase RecQ
MDILKFQQGTDGSSLYLQKNRCNIGELMLDVERIKRLKKSLEFRIREMLTYLENDWECRSVLLGKYFGEHYERKCGCCDNCTEQIRLPLDALQVKIKIREILNGAPNSEFQDLSSHFPGLSKDSLIQQLRNLQEEGFCRVLSNGTILLQ